MFRDGTLRINKRMFSYYIYCRKSSESEDRQVLSIESQETELKRMAEKMNLHVIGIMRESRSAKAPGRLVFNEMINNIEKGKADGIICWKLDRLARNFLDGGKIIQMLQESAIKKIHTCDREYRPEDNVLLMSVELGMANQYILDLRKNVKRGLKTKAEKGWLPTSAPIGYLNDKSKEKGNRDIIKDPERFDMIKKIWKMMIKGTRTPPLIAKIANEKWGLRTRQGKPLARSTIYSLLTNSFYYGYFEYPMGSGNWYQGKHEPMIDAEEFDRVQILLGRKDKPRIKKHEFAFIGLLRCGECGGMVTAEEKNQIICSICKYKFSSNNKQHCPQCNIPIISMKKPKILKYVYYHCTKKKKPDCSQRSVEIKDLETLIQESLSSIKISECFKEWGWKYIKEDIKNETALKMIISKSRSKAHDDCLKKLANLFQLKISPLNNNGNLISDDEYGKQKTKLMTEKRRLEEIMNSEKRQIETWLDTMEKSLDFACNAQFWFKNGTNKDKTDILRIFGSNLILRDRKLFIEPKNHFKPIECLVDDVKQVREEFEPENSCLDKEEIETVYSKNPIVLREMDKVRTWIWNGIKSSHIPHVQQVALDLLRAFDELEKSLGERNTR